MSIEKENQYGYVVTMQFMDPLDGAHDPKSYKLGQGN